MALTLIEMVMAAKQQLSPAQYAELERQVAGSSNPADAFGAFKSLADQGTLSIPGYTPAPQQAPVPTVIPQTNDTTINIPSGFNVDQELSAYNPPDSTTIDPTTGNLAGNQAQVFQGNPPPITQGTPTGAPQATSTFNVDQELSAYNPPDSTTIDPTTGNLAGNQAQVFQGNPPPITQGTPTVVPQATSTFNVDQELSVDNPPDGTTIDPVTGNLTGNQAQNFQENPPPITQGTPTGAEQAIPDPTRLSSYVGDTTVNVNDATQPISQLNTWEIPTDVFPTSTSQSSNIGTSGSTSSGQSTSGSQSGSTSTGRSYSGVDFGTPLNQAILPNLISSATGLQQKTDDLGRSLNDMYSNQMRRAFSPENFQGILNTLSNRNVLNSDITSDALGRAGHLAAKTIADKAFESQIAQAQNQLAVPNILGNLAALGQTSTSATDSGSTSTSFSDAMNQASSYSDTSGQSSAFQADPSKPYDIMSRLLTF